MATAPSIPTPDLAIAAYWWYSLLTVLVYTTGYLPNYKSGKTGKLKVDAEKSKLIATLTPLFANAVKLYPRSSFDKNTSNWPAPFNTITKGGTFLSSMIGLLTISESVGITLGLKNPKGLFLALDLFITFYTKSLNPFQK
jgi:hypothetical protein